MKHICLFFTFSILFLAGCEKKPAEKTEQTSVGKTKKPTEPLTDEPGIILFFGNSLTAGYGLDPSESFSALIGRRLDSLNYNYRTVNAGLSGETTASGKNRLDWVLREKPLIFVLELGANDGLRGIPPAETRRNLTEIVAKVRAAVPGIPVVLAGMRVPPNMGQEYAEEFDKIFPELAAELELNLIPFLLENVAGKPELNLPDGIHPTAEGHRIVTENIWKVLEAVLIKSN